MYLFKNASRPMAQVKGTSVNETRVHDERYRQKASLTLNVCGVVPGHMEEKRC